MFNLEKNLNKALNIEIKYEDNKIIKMSKVLLKKIKKIKSIKPPGKILRYFAKNKQKKFYPHSGDQIWKSKVILLKIKGPLLNLLDTIQKQ